MASDTTADDDDERLGAADVDLRGCRGAGRGDGADCLLSAIWTGRESGVGGSSRAAVRPGARRAFPEGHSVSSGGGVSLADTESLLNVMLSMFQKGLNYWVVLLKKVEERFQGQP